MRHYLTCLVFLIVLFGSIYKSSGQSSDNCFTMIAGKDATADGSVMLAHNEDGPGFIMINWYKVPHLKHSESQIIRFHSGAEIKEAAETNAYLWLEMPAHSFSDSYMNEYGLVITSNQCLSREDKPQLRDGGIGYELRKLMTERAKTARDAIKLAGWLIDSYGYNSSGRTYSIADNHEAWMLSVVYGKHWVAKRIPDNEVAIIPNYFTISVVDLSDTLNYLGSPDLISYAEIRGWYDPAGTSLFSFRSAYSDPANLIGQGNIAQHWQALNTISEKHYQLDDVFPFSVIPRIKINIQSFRSMLSNHYEGTPLENEDTELSDPHSSEIMRICSDHNQYGFVAQLRSTMPIEIGAVLWIAPRYPCMHPFIPWYNGIQTVPEIYSENDYDFALEHHFDETRKTSEIRQKAYVLFLEFGQMVNSDYYKNIKKIQPVTDKMQLKILDRQRSKKKHFMNLYRRNKDQADKVMTDYTSQLVTSEYNRIRKRLHY